jgi:hypothetical protein
VLVEAPGQIVRVAVERSPATVLLRAASLVGTAVLRVLSLLAARGRGRRGSRGKGGGGGSGSRRARRSPSFYPDVGTILPGRTDNSELEYYM